MCVEVAQVLGFIGHFKGDHMFPCDIHAEMRALPGPPHDFGPKPDYNFTEFVARRGFKGMFAPFDQRKGPPGGGGG